MDSSTSARFRFAALWIALLAVYLIGNERVPLWDRDEPRYAVASRHMAQTGDWIVPMFLDEPRTKKPVLIYWLQAASMRAFGESALAARLPSAVASLLTVVVLAIVLRRCIGTERAWWATFIFATSAMVVASAKMSLTDALLLLWILIAQLSLFVIVTGRGTWGACAILGVAIGLAGLTKGPLVLGVLATTLAALLVLRWWDRSSTTGVLGLGSFEWSVSRFLSKMLLIVALVVVVLLPWLLAMESRIPGYTWNTIRSEVIERAGKPQEGHTGPPGYYVLTIWATYFPWSLLLPGAIISAWRNRRDPLIRFSLAAVVGPWVMLEIVQTKLPHYLLAVFPFLAIVTADMVVRAMRRETDDLSNRGFRFAVSAWSIVIGALTLLVWLVPLRFEMSSGLIVGSILVTFVGIAYAGIVFRLFTAQQPARALITMGGGFLGLILICSTLYLPNASFLHMSPRIAQVLLEHGATAPGSVRMIGYKEPSLAFYQGGTIREEPRDELLITTSPDEWPPFLVVTRPIFDRAPESARARLEILNTVRGLNYAAGRIVEVLIVRKRDLIDPVDPDGASTHPSTPPHSN
jgi:4-amino-4-deoxy-L-arabinose transferase-like glycosyltransferase